MVTVWQSAAHLHYSFLNLNETIMSQKYAQQISEIHWKLQHLQLALVNTKGPTLWDNARLHVTQPTLQELNELGYEVWPYLPYSPDLLPTDYPFFKYLNNFLHGKCFHNQQDAENAFWELLESQSMFFLFLFSTVRISKFISSWQSCVDLNCSYSD